MLSYKEYEQKVYNWLSLKNDKDPNFTFSVRRQSAKGAEGDYFIGTEQSGYFATTFWTLPVAFPGSSGDCIPLIFRISDKGLNYHFEFKQTKQPHDAQNESALNLCKSLTEELSEKPGLHRQSPDRAKMFMLLTNPKRRNYQSVEEMTKDIDLELDHIIKLVDKKITEEKKQNGNFVAHRITAPEFSVMTQKLHERIAKHNTSNDSKSGSTDVRYWLYSPGEQAFLWEDFYKFGIMALGWDDLGDLSQYISKEEIERKLQFLDNTEKSKINNATANYEFAKVMQVGDFVIVKKGRRELLGYGIVSSDHYYDITSDEYHNSRKVEWKKKGNWATDHDMALKTLTDVTRYKEPEAAQFENYYERLLGTMADTNIFSESSGAVSTYNAPLNQILYGPPGTGKTYNTVLEAAKIVSGKNDLSFDEALKIFNSNLKDQIEFITFHQNFSYEDFIQGLRPDIDNKQLSFERKDGVFKKIADKAYLNLLASEKKQSQKLPFIEVFQNFALSNIEEDKEIEVKMKKTSYFITDISDKTIYFRKTSGGTGHTLSIQTLERMYFSESTGEIQGLATYYEPLLNILLQKGKSSSVHEVKRLNYVIIIDEINRANISRVFGELITLIEEDKRSHGKVPMSVTLPSGDNFIVPSNLYIIGTMNTADKSIALLDIALRRRFEFVPMYPQYEIEGKNIHRPDVLKYINEKICKLKTRDFQIGHAYFMESNDLEHIMNRKVIPLLMEYFMNDEKTVKDIISIPNCTIDTDQWPMKFSQN